MLDGATAAILELPAGEAAAPAVVLVDDTVEALDPVTDLVTDTTTALADPLADPLEAVGDLGGTIETVIGTVTSTVDTAVPARLCRRSPGTWAMWSRASRTQVLPAVLDGATDAILELPGGEAAVPAVELVDDTVEALGPVTDTTTAGSRVPRARCRARPRRSRLRWDRWRAGDGYDDRR